MPSISFSADRELLFGSMRKNAASTWGEIANFPDAVKSGSQDIQSAVKVLRHWLQNIDQLAWTLSLSLFNASLSI